MKKMTAALLALILLGCSNEQQQTDTGVQQSTLSSNWSEPRQGQATPATIAHNQRIATSLSRADDEDIKKARKGFLSKIETDAIRNHKGDIVWDIDAYGFIDGPAPETVNPSLWRQSKLTSIQGLFEVTEGLYQIRGYDLAVMSVIKGDKGWIVIDPLTTSETAAAALGLVNTTLGERPVTAVLYTHSHADHFGGVRGVLTQEQIDSGTVPIIAPHGFTESALTENLLAGPHMARRSLFMFGLTLPVSDKGHIGSGLGPSLGNGSVGFVPPTMELGKEGGELNIDGIEFEFVDAGGTEAPAEFMFYLPQFKALCTAEVATGTLHNALTLRGARARDTLRWSERIDAVLRQYGGRAEIQFASHHWPTWGKEQVAAFLRAQRDTYRYLHDQTLRYANAGETIVEAAEAVTESYSTDDTEGSPFHTRGYYGTLNHNAKAVYQFYYGWWDGVPANFYTHPPAERADRFVEAIGGHDAALEKGRLAFNEGDYRWAAEIFNAIVFSDVASEAGKNWLAATYEQLGFQAESGAWRSYYLTAAKELRAGPPKLDRGLLSNEEFLSAVPIEELFNALAVRYRPEKMKREPYVINFSFTDTGEQLALEVGRHSVFPRYGQVSDEAVAEFIIKRSNFDQLLLQKKNALVLMASGQLKVKGERGAVTAFFDSLDKLSPNFNIVEP